MKTYILLKKFFKEKIGYIILLSIVIILGIILESINPYLFGKIIDNISKNKKMVMGRYFFWYTAILFSIQILGCFEKILGKSIVLNIVNRIKHTLFGCVVAMPYYKSQEFEQGELLNRIEFDASIIVDYYMDFVSSIFMIIGNFFISLYFLMKISNILTLISVVLISLMYTAVRSGLQYAGKKAAKESCVTQMLMPSRIENDLVYAVGEERLGRSIVRGGSSGIDCSRSKMSARTGIGKLTAEYQVVIPVPLFGIAPVKCSEKMKIKAWSGYEREGWMDTGNDTVYVTETGLVYHKDYHCSHLDLSIRMTHLELVEGLRNENGGKYYPCEHCVKGNGGNIYITNSGDRYHSSLSCSGLKRTIYAIPISEAAGKGACSRCGQ